MLVPALIFFRILVSMEKAGAAHSKSLLPHSMWHGGSSSPPLFAELTLTPDPWVLGLAHAWVSFGLLARLALRRLLVER